MSTLRINLWSGPRNVSTALMYAFAQRTDTRVVDEPLYAHYLRVSGAQHPGRDEVLRAQEGDGEQVVRAVVLGPATGPCCSSQMAHHWSSSPIVLRHCANVVLTRDPLDMLPSLVHQIPGRRCATRATLRRSWSTSCARWAKNRRCSTRASCCSIRARC